MVLWRQSEGEAMVVDHCIGFDSGEEVEMKVGEETPLLGSFWV